MPDSIHRLENAPVATGEMIDTFKVWPTAHPRVTLEQSEHISVRFRIWPGQPRIDQEQANAGGSTENAAYTQPTRSFDASVGLKVIPPGSSQIKSLVTQDVGRPIYWVDLDIGPLDEPGGYYWRLSPPAGFKDLADLRFELVVTVLGEALIATPSWTGPIEVSLSSQSGAGPIGRIGVRKLVGSFHVSAVSSTLPFLQVEPQVLIDGQNYIVKVSVKPVQGLRAGTTVDGVVNVETDDPRRPHMEIPCKIRLVP